MRGAGPDLRSHSDTRACPDEPDEVGLTWTNRQTLKRTKSCCWKSHLRVSAPLWLFTCWTDSSFGLPRPTEWEQFLITDPGDGGTRLLPGLHAVRARVRDSGGPAGGAATGRRHAVAPGAVRRLTGPAWQR